MVCAGGPNATFDYLVDDLRPLQNEFRLVDHDYRGSGRSSTASETTYTFEQFADDAAALAAHLWRAVSTELDGSGMRHSGAFELGDTHLTRQ
jgi:hypothetical protein